MGAEGGPLSKRLGSLSMERLRNAGYFPDALNNYLARLGHYTPYDDWLSRGQLAKRFSTDNLNTAPAHFDERQLQYWQHRTMQMLESDTVHKAIEREVKDLVPKTDLVKFVATVKPNIDFPNQARGWALAIYSDHIHYNDEARQWLTHAGSVFFEAAKKALQQHGLDYEQLCEIIKSEAGVKGKALFKPLRSALTGEIQGPELANLVTLMGDKRVSQRLDEALKQVET
jgi:glutamyl-tRNA synthetase